MHPDFIGVASGILIGLLGGIAGTYYSIKNASGSRERDFMVKSAVVIWIAVIIFGILMVVLDSPYRYFLWIPYGIGMPLGIIYINRKQRRIRQEEDKKNVR